MAEKKGCINFTSFHLPSIFKPDKPLPLAQPFYFGEVTGATFPNRTS